jgi:formylglycine-generating enzyme required for sulfatase activity
MSKPAHYRYALVAASSIACVKLLGLEDVEFRAPFLEAGVAATMRDPRCPQGRGPDMVYVDAKNSLPAFCIDSSEVNAGQYRAFIADGAPLAKDARCKWNTGADGPSTDVSDRLPATDVDWCDAQSFCQWSSKKLCGKADGTPSSFIGGAPDNAWILACSAHGQKLYPYGARFNESACNIGGNLEPVLTRSACLGGYPGIYDMGGNAEEWLDSCNATDGGASSALCTTTFALAVERPSATALDRVCNKAFEGQDAISAKRPTLGFRCCATPSSD